MNAPARRPASLRRAGLNALEVIVVTILLVLFVLTALMILPRQREVARLAACRQNLMQIGQGLAMYERVEGCLPTVGALDAGGPKGPAPLRELLDALVIPDLRGLSIQAGLPKPMPGSVPGERSVAGFMCPSDPLATSGVHPAPISYRATTGDQPDGRNGGFAPGRRLKSADIEEKDGRSFTAAFSERLVGTGKDGMPSGRDYQLLAGEAGPESCPPGPSSSYRGDAGASWVTAGWRSTLYNHVLPPNAPYSCVAGSGKSALMGASSGHIPGVNVLFFDQSVRTVTPGVSPAIWKAMATIESPVPQPTRPIPVDPGPPAP